MVTAKPKNIRASGQQELGFWESGSATPARLHKAPVAAFQPRLGGAGLLRLPDFPLRGAGGYTEDGGFSSGVGKSRSAAGPQYCRWLECSALGSGRLKRSWADGAPGLRRSKTTQKAPRAGPGSKRPFRQA